MATLEDLGEVISTDVLVIGGGIGGLVTAVKAKEENPKTDVLIVEKQTTGWAGKATKIGGILAFLGPNNNGKIHRFSSPHFRPLPERPGDIV